jgi:hypothetical protein
VELTPQQIVALERLHARDFEIVAFAMYASHVGVRKRNCAALLTPVAAGGFQLFGLPSYLIAGNFSVRVTRDGRDWFVWKKVKVEVTPERVAELAAFSEELSAGLLSVP